MANNHTITITVAVVCLGAGFAAGRVTAPKPEPPRAGLAALADALDRVAKPSRQGTPQVAASSPTPAPRATPQPSQPFSGSGKSATKLFPLSAGLVTFQMHHTGERNFIVELFDENGAQLETLANEIGQFSGTKAVTVPHSGRYLLAVEAGGDWTIVATPPS